MSTEGVGTNYVGDKLESYGGYKWKIPRCFGIHSKQNRINTINHSGYIEQIGKDRRYFSKSAVVSRLSAQAIKRTLYELMIDGIKYHKIGETEYYALELFDDKILKFI